jgi:hypothetical protein
MSVCNVKNSILLIEKAFVVFASDCGKRIYAYFLKRGVTTEEAAIYTVITINVLRVMMEKRS